MSSRVKLLSACCLVAGILLTAGYISRPHDTVAGVDRQRPPAALPEAGRTIQSSGNAVDVIFIIDGSGSIDEGAFRLQREGIALTIEDALDSQIPMAVSIIQFSGYARVEHPQGWDNWTTIDGDTAGPLAAFLREDDPEEDHIEQIGYSTKLIPALELAVELLQGRDAPVRHIILSTDARVAEVECNVLDKCEEIRTMTPIVKICTIGIGVTPDSADEDFLLNCANHHDAPAYHPGQIAGNYVNIEVGGAGEFADLAANCLCVADADACNENGIPDLCEVDCNDNGIPDECDIADGTSQDANGDGIPDNEDGCRFAIDPNQPCGWHLGTGNFRDPLVGLDDRDSKITAMAGDCTTELVAVGKHIWIDGQPYSVGHWDPDFGWRPMQGFLSNSSIVGAVAEIDGQFYIAGGLVWEVDDDTNCPPQYTCYEGAPQEEGLLAVWGGGDWFRLPADGSITSGRKGRAIAEFQGSIYVGGTFDWYDDGFRVENIVRFNGADWAPVGAGVGLLSGSSATQGVYSFETHDDGRGEALFVGGLFDSAFVPGDPDPIEIPDTYGIARWDGATWSSLAGGLQDPRIWPCGDDMGCCEDCFCGCPGYIVRALEVHQDSLYVGGEFNEIVDFGDDFKNLARWDDGAWHTVDSECEQSRGIPGVINALLEHNDGTGDVLFVGGDFSWPGVQDIEAENIFSWDGQCWQTVGGGTDDDVLALHEFDYSLILGGTFDKVWTLDEDGWLDQSFTSYGAARWTGECGACCFTDGSCQDNHSIGACINYGGEYQGPGSECGDLDCPVVTTGACCDSQDSCSELPAESCGGHYQGDNSTCAATNCCWPDIGGDGFAGFADIIAILAAWGACGDDCPEDLDRNGEVEFGDILVILANWGPC